MSRRTNQKRTEEGQKKTASNNIHKLHRISTPPVRTETERFLSGIGMNPHRRSTAIRIHRVIWMSIEGTPGDKICDSVSSGKSFRRDTSEKVGRAQYLAMTETVLCMKKEEHMRLRSNGLPLGMGYEHMEKVHP